jgi:hypothetical protein
VIDYIFRNKETSKEFKISSKRNIAVKHFSDPDYRLKNNIPNGYELNQVVDYRTTAKERKAK